MAETIYQLKVTLEDIQSPIWRRFQVGSSITFRELHKTLQVVMGWWIYYLYLIQIGSLTITDGETLTEWGRLASRMMWPGSRSTYNRRARLTPTSMTSAIAGSMIGFRKDTAGR